LQGIGGDALDKQGERRTHDLGRGTAAVEGGVAARGEFAMAGLTAPIGEVVVAVGAVAHEGLHARIRYQAVGAVGIEARVAFGRDGLLATAWALDLVPRWRRGIGQMQSGRSDGVRSAARAIVFGTGREWLGNLGLQVSPAGHRGEPTGQIGQEPGQAQPEQHGQQP